MARCTFHSFWQAFPFIIPLLTSAFQVKERPKQVNRPLICTPLPELIAAYKVIFATTCGSASAHLLQRGSPWAALFSSDQAAAQSTPCTTKQSLTFSRSRRGWEPKLLYRISVWQLR